jgi:ATP-binding cassette, subfamily B, bacterial PglK
MLKKIWFHISKRRQKQFSFLLLLMLLASIFEVISIGAVLPFLGALTSPDQVFQHQLLQPLIKLLDLKEPSQLILPLTIIFITTVIFAGVIRLLLLYSMTRLSYATGADLSINIYQRTLYQEYSIHMARNSSEVINGIVTKTNAVITGVITPILTLISSVILLIGIMSALFIIDLKIALTVFIGLGLIYFLVIRFTKKQLKDNSKIIANQSTQLIKSIQEGLGGIRDVLIDGSQQFYCDLYRNADLPIRHASGNNIFISVSPRYVMEAIGMTLIASIAYMISQQGDTMTAIPVLGALALGAQRLLPALQQAYGSYSMMKGVSSSFQDVLTLLEQPLPDYINQSLAAPMPFKKEIQLKKINFRYTKDTDWILKDINLTIAKGMRVGFIGTTGSGKSTLLDVIMGLLTPTEGEISIDNQPVTIENRREWQAHIAHVPQSIYLFDSSIEENIAFAIPEGKINRQRVKKVAADAQISKLIEGWKNGYKTSVGEQGVRISGGQRQRIGIARALYKDASVLIFDEATSALDSETEKSVMESIVALDKDLTILIVAHRLTTLKGCDLVVRLDKNNIVQIGSYKEMVHI